MEFRGNKDARMKMIGKLNSISENERIKMAKDYIWMWEAWWCLAIWDWLFKIRGRLLDSKNELQYWSLFAWLKFELLGDNPPLLQNENIEPINLSLILLGLKLAGVPDHWKSSINPLNSNFPPRRNSVFRKSSIDPQFRKKSIIS